MEVPMAAVVKGAVLVTVEVTEAVAGVVVAAAATAAVAVVGAEAAVAASTPVAAAFTTYHLPRKNVRQGLPGKIQ